jgi:polar amino acid transport system substrate-binding protein
MTTRIVAPILFLLTVVAALAACAPADDSLSRVQESGTLRIGLDPTYPPFELADDSGLSGLDVELANSLSDGLGVVPAFTYFGYDGLYDALLTGQVDVLLSALVISPERTRDFAYSRPYYDAGQILIVHAASPIRTSADLTTGRVAVELGALGHVEALALAQTLPGLTVIPHGSAAEALDALAAGEADAALVDSISGRLYLRDRPPDAPALRRLPELVAAEPFALVVRSEDVALLRQLNAQLAAMAADGRLDALIARWVGP